MPRILLILRLLIALAWPAGMLVWAWEMHGAFADQKGLVPYVWYVVDAWVAFASQSGPNRYAPLVSQETLGLQTASLALNHSAQWVSWYYSMSNIRHWGQALYAFAPAVFLTLLHWALRGRR